MADPEDTTETTPGKNAFDDDEVGASFQMDPTAHPECAYCTEEIDVAGFRCIKVSSFWKVESVYCDYRCLMLNGVQAYNE